MRVHYTLGARRCPGGIKYRRDLIRRHLWKRNAARAFHRRQPSVDREQVGAFAADLFAERRQFRLAETELGFGVLQDICDFSRFQAVVHGNGDKPRLKASEIQGHRLNGIWPYRWQRMATVLRTVVWQGSAGDRRPYADQTAF